MNTTSMASPAFSHGLGANANAGNVAAGPVSTSNLTPLIKQLYEASLAAAKGMAAAAIAAVRALWRWMLALVERIARALGLKASGPQQLTDGQATGEHDTSVDLHAPGNAANALRAPGAPQADSVAPEVASQVVLAEAQRLVDHLASTLTDPAILANPETAHEFVRFQARKLGEYRAAFLQHAQELEGEAHEKLSELATAAGTTPAVIRAQLASNHDGGLYDKDGSLRKVLKEAQDARLSAGRVELAAISLLDACGHPTAQPGLREHAWEQLSAHMPGVPFDREPPPRGDVSAASGETSATGGDATAHVVADAPVLEEAVADRVAHAQDTAGTGSLSRHPLAAKNTLESAAVAEPSDAAAARTKLSLVNAPNAIADAPQGNLPASAAMTQEALASPFAGGSFAKLRELADRRQLDSPRAWRETPTDR